MVSLRTEEAHGLGKKVQTSVYKSKRITYELSGQVYKSVCLDGIIIFSFSHTHSIGKLLRSVA